MKNIIQKYESAQGLIEEDPFNNHYQAPIFLALDWNNETVDVTVLYRDGSTPGDVWHRLRSLIPLPLGVDARHMHDDVDELLSRIEKIRAGFESVWDGNNWVGKFTDAAESELGSLAYEITENNNLFTCHEGGLFKVQDLFDGKVDEINANTTDDEIKALADEYETAAAGESYVIIGGTESIVDFFKKIRADLQD